MTDEKNLEDAAVQFGNLFAAGLNKLSDAAQFKLNEALNNGGKLFATVETEPFIVIGSIRDTNGKTLELFRLGFGETKH